MTKIITAVSLYLGMSLLANYASACFFHYGQGYGGFSGDQANPTAAFTAPEKIFSVKHPPTAVAIINEYSEITLEYDRPITSKNVSIQLTGSANVELLDQNIELIDFSGEITARFRLTGKGFDVITITVTGEHNGDSLRYSSRVYVRAKQAAPPLTMEVTSR